MQNDDLEALEEEARVCRKWAVEKSDWLDNMAVQERYKGDPATLVRRADETAAMFDLAKRLDKRIAAMKAKLRNSLDEGQEKIEKNKAEALETPSAII